LYNCVSCVTITVSPAKNNYGELLLLLSALGLSALARACETPDWLLLTARHFPSAARGRLVRERDRALCHGNSIEHAFRARTHHASCRCDGISPLCGRFGPEDPQCGSGDEVALEVEGVVNRTVHVEKAQRRSSRLEPLQLALASSDCLMRILRPIVLSKPLLMPSSSAAERSTRSQLPASRYRTLLPWSPEIRLWRLAGTGIL
jgi:hypothetical protein